MSLEAGSASGGSFNLYCNQCIKKYECNRENKRYQLQTTTDAIDLHNLIVNKISIGYNEMPEKIYTLMLKIKEHIESKNE